MAENGFPTNDSPRLFSYIDYRKYLADHYEYKKRIVRGFSYRSLSRKAGFSSVSYVHHVMQGKRKITDNALEGFLKALELSSRERSYFENLVRFNQATDPDSKRRYYEQLLPIYRDETGTKLTREQYRFYSKWYGPVIREMVALKDFRESGEWISRRLRNLVTPVEAQRMLGLLLKLGLIERNAEGRLVITHLNLTTPAEVRELTLLKFHQDMLKRADDVLAKDDSGDREVSCITASLTREQFGRLKAEIQEFENRIMQDLENSSAGMGDEVYQFNCQLFALTKRIEETNGNKE